MQTDAELLAYYVKTGDEDAYAKLVERYASLVYATALRLTNGDAHLAEDVMQEVFIRLIQKAPALIRHEALAGWLHTTTRYVALRAIRGRRRREIREQEAVTMNANTAPKIHWEELSPLLDEAVGQLNDRDRQAVLLRYFQGWSHRKVGAALGLNEDAARVRTDRAVEKLRHYFEQRGILTSSVLLAEALAANSAPAAPVALVRNAQAASLACAQELGFGYAVLKLIFMNTKLKFVLPAAIVVLAVVFFARLAGQSSTSTPKTTPVVTAKAPNAAPPLAQVEKPVTPPAAIISPADQAAAAVLTETQKKDVAELKTLLANLANATRAQQPIFDFWSPKQLTKWGFTPVIIAKMRAREIFLIEAPAGASDELTETLKHQANIYEAFARAYEEMESQVPKFNAAGDEAIYEKIEATYEDMDNGTFSGQGEHLREPFIKIDGKWYLNEEIGWTPNADGTGAPPIQPDPEINSASAPIAPEDPFAP